MSPLTSNQIVGLAKILGHEYPGGVAFKAGDPVAEHSLVGVLHPRRDVRTGQLIVWNKNRVAHVHLAKRDVDGVALTGVAGWQWCAFFDGEHAAVPSGWVSKRRVKQELNGMHTRKGRYLLLPKSNHLVGAGGSGCRPRVTGVSPTATTATSYYFKRMAREWVLYGYPVKMGIGTGPQLYDAKRSVAEVAVGVGRACSPGGPWVSAATSCGGSPRLNPAPNTRRNADWASTQDLRITANSAEVGK